MIPISTRLRLPVGNADARTQVIISDFHNLTVDSVGKVGG
jgi:hypothetical protein